MMFERITVEMSDSGKLTGIGVTFSIPTAITSVRSNMRIYCHRILRREKLILTCFRRGTYYQRTTIVYRGVTAQVSGYLRNHKDHTEDYLKVFLIFFKRLTSTFKLVCNSDHIIQL